MRQPRQSAAVAVLLAMQAEVGMGQFQFEIPRGAFQQMGGMGGFPGGMGGGDPRMQRQQRGGGSSIPVGIDQAYDWLKGTSWNWNGWRDIKFTPDGKFDAPTPDCQGGACEWTTDDQYVYIQWGQAGLHKVKATRMEAIEGTKLRGKRVRDGERCEATFLGKEEPSWEEDFYVVLNITDEATDKDIKKAYRKLSLKYHPDKCQGEVQLEVEGEDEPVTKKCDEMMNLVNLANEILGDPDKRILYDTGGMESVQQGMREDEQGGGGGGMDPFSMLFGGGGGGGQRKGAGSKRGPDSQVELGVSLEDMYSGNEVEAAISRRVVCRKCAGKTTGKCAECGRCPNEVRMVQRQMGPGMVVQQEEEVQSKEKCKNEQATLKANVERGMDTGSEIRFPRMSEQRPGQIPGDIVMTLKQKRHQVFRREGNDLHMDVDITLREALLGFSKTVVHLDEHEVVIRRTKITRPEEVQKIKEEGMPKKDFPSEFGDLYVKFHFRMPATLSDEQKKALEEIFPQ